MVENYKDCPGRLPFDLWGYRILTHTSTEATLNSLMQGLGLVVPIEVAIPSLREIMESHIPEAEWVKAPYEELLMLDKRRLQALHNVRLYQSQISRGFNKKVKPKDLQKGNYLLSGPSKYNA